MYPIGINFDFTDPSKYILLSLISLRSVMVLVGRAKKARCHSAVHPAKRSCYTGYRKMVTKFTNISYQLLNKSL